MLSLIAAICLAQGESIPKSLKKSLTFYAGFDRGLDADYARGDSRIYSAPSYKELDKTQPGIGASPAEIIRDAGGGALRFTKKNTSALFFRGAGNMPYEARNWAATVSFWLRVNPEQELAPGFTDPIQITDKTYDDAAIWVDFTKENPRRFRLGIFGDRSSWNRMSVPADKNPDFERRLVVVERPPFTQENWTHVAVAWSGINSGQPGRATLYLDGRPVGTAAGIAEPFQWNVANTTIRVGVNYVGLFDDFAVFERALTPGEIQQIYRARQR